MRKLRMAVLGSLLLGMSIGLLAMAGTDADASVVCRAAPTESTVTVSPDGERVQGSDCSDLIIATSPEIREIIGGEGDDVIYANPGVEVVNGEAGDDVIYGELPAVESDTASYGGSEGVVYSRRTRNLLRRAGSSPAAIASIVKKECKAGVSCYGGDGSQELVGSSGNDKIFGQRGNDILKGNNGNDELFGGVGDESLISGGSGTDLLSGGLGTDTLNGNQEGDLLRGDGTIDSIEDTGAEGTDTLSFATGVTPGFHGLVAPSGFPADSAGEERGVSIYLNGTTCEGYQSCNSEARYGGGLDEIAVSGFENVIGSPFADEIVGSSGANRIDGGGGADVIDGSGGSDEIYGGADGDYIEGGEGTDTVYGQGGTNHCASDAETQNQCSGTTESVVQRDRSKISAGFMATSLPATMNWSAVYLTGSTGTDRAKAVYSLEGGIGYVTFTAEAESATFDVSEDAVSAGCAYEATKVKCTLPKPLDSIVMAGNGGDDRLILEGFPETSTPVMLGGEGGDELFGGNGSEDMLVDGNGAGNDLLKGYAYDDALINNEGKDNLEGGNGNDLLLSAVNCEGDSLQGAEAGSGDGAAVNSSSWAKLPAGAPGVFADIEAGSAGDKSGPGCTSGETGKLFNIDDLEGSSGNDKLNGDAAGNNLLGRLGVDELFGRAGNDNIESAEDSTADTVGGGTGTEDTCRYDLAFDTISGCEKKTGV